MAVEVRQARPDQLSALASVLGRSFVDEPMVRWPLGDVADAEERLIRWFEYFLEGFLELGMVWEAGDGMGAAVWISPEHADSWETQTGQARIHALTADGGRRYEVFWDWVESKMPEEPLWHLDSVGVEPAAQGRGIGSALVEFGLGRARGDGVGVLLETGTLRNVPYYDRFGFRVVEAADAPEGGPRIWWMRWDA